VEPVDHERTHGGPGPEAERAAGGEDAKCQPKSVARCDVADGGHHHAAVAELEPDQEHSADQLPWRDAGGYHPEHHRLDESAAHDHGLTAVLVRPDAPQRNERQTGQEEERAQDSDQMLDFGSGYSHFGQPVWQEGPDLRHAEAFDE